MKARAFLLFFFIPLVAAPILAQGPTLSITDNNYGQGTKDFSVSLGATPTNTVMWVASELEGRSGMLFLRFDTAPTVELLPADLTVTFAGSPVTAIKVSFNSMEFNPVATIPDLATGGTISYSVTFNKELELNNSRIGIHAVGQPFVASNELSHQITVIPAFIPEFPISTLPLRTIIRQSKSRSGQVVWRNRLL